MDLSDQPNGYPGTMSTISDVSNNPMLNAKLTRLKVQQDVELLSNRVERLRAEERKAKQKVLETKLRGQEIIALQKRNEQLSAAKSLAKQLEYDQRNREMQQVRQCTGHARSLTRSLGCVRENGCVVLYRRRPANASVP